MVTRLIGFNRGLGNRLHDLHAASTRSPHGLHTIGIRRAPLDAGLSRERITAIPWLLLYRPRNRTQIMRRSGQSGKPTHMSGSPAGSPPHPGFRPPNYCPARRSGHPCCCTSIAASGARRGPVIGDVEAVPGAARNPRIKARQRAKFGVRRIHQIPAGVADVGVAVPQGDDRAVGDRVVVQAPAHGQVHEMEVAIAHAVPCEWFRGSRRTPPGDRQRREGDQDSVLIICKLLVRLA